MDKGNYMINQENAIQNLSELNKIFQKYNVRHWLQDGTLLGYYRENNFISYDKDTDIGLFYSDFNLNIMKEIIISGFRVKRALGDQKDSFEITLIRNKIKTDLFFYYERPENSNLIYHCSFSKERERIDYEYTKFNTKEITWFGRPFFVPENEEKFLITKYGEDWMVPEEEWDYVTSPLNHIRTGIIMPEEKSNEEFKKWLIS
jgi:phosphorylcholine metabolism protein LicD